MKKIDRILSFLFCFFFVISLISDPFIAHASEKGSHSQVLEDYGLLAYFASWFTGTKVFQSVDSEPSSGSSGNYAVNTPRNYYTTCTSSTQDQYGNVTNYYRGGDTTNTSIIDSYNHTFNTIHNTTNNTMTNNYKANVRLSDFLNNYTTNNITNTTNNKYTYPFAHLKPFPFSCTIEIEKGAVSNVQTGKEGLS